MIADWAVVVARAYNDWLHEHFLRVSPRFKGVALLAVQEPAEAAKELERCVRDLGMVGGMLAAVMNPMRGYGLPQFDPIFAAAERLNVPLGVHAGSAAELGLDHFTSFAGVYPLEPSVRSDAATHQHDDPRRVRTLSEAARGVS